MKIYIKNRIRRSDEFQFYMHQFVESCINYGFESKRDLFPSYKNHIRAVLRRVLLFIYNVLHNYLQQLIKRKKALLITANGVSIPDNIFPYYFNCEIVPMLWDVWPSTWKRMYNAFELYDIRTVFVTSSQVADMINKETKVKAYWIPEGIDETVYNKGNNLCERTIDVLELGRQHKELHPIIYKLSKEGVIGNFITSITNVDGTLSAKHLTFKSTKDMIHALSDTKIFICFPQCDTNPQRAGNIETLTQRYWEGMLSRCVMIGRAPKELVQLIGYNPVVEIDWSNVESQLLSIVNNISEYQQLVDKNYESQ